MASNRPDPGEFFDLAQRMLRELFSGPGNENDPWAEATRRSREHPETLPGTRELTPERQRQNLTFALATRAVEALEDLALNVAAIRQRLERMDPPASGARSAKRGTGSEGPEAAGQ
jgi:hypothetical protein